MFLFLHMIAGLVEPPLLPAGKPKMAEAGQKHKGSNSIGLKL